MTELNYRLGDKIGEGSYGIVYKGYRRENNELVAIKQIRADILDDGVPYCIIREVAILRELQHENIVKLLDTVCHNGRLYIVLEYMATDLKEYMRSIHSTQKLAVEQVRSYMYQVLLALAFCHKRRLIHRDLKPQNLLVEKSGRIKIADFGMARPYEIPIRTYSQRVVTLWYRAPEILLGGRHYSLPSDIWSVGCIFAEMVLMDPLFPGDSEVDMIYKIFQCLGTPSPELVYKITANREANTNFPMWNGVFDEKVAPHFDKDGLDLIMKMLVYEPEKRITALEALDHPYFTPIHLAKKTLVQKTMEAAAKVKKMEEDRLAALKKNDYKPNMPVTKTPTPSGN